jgi:drug/metabolite transporter (DMT)-like permease
VVSGAAASALLGETVAWTRIVGILAILLGSVGLAKRGDSGSDEPIDRGAQSRRSYPSLSQSFRRGTLYPVVAALAFSAFDIMVKRSLRVMDDPTFAASLTLGSGFAAWLILAFSLPALRRSFPSTEAPPGLRWAGSSSDSRRSASFMPS